MDHPRSNVPYSLWGLEGVGVGQYVEGMGEVKGVGTWLVCIMKKDNLLPLTKKEKENTPLSKFWLLVKV